VRYKKNNRQQVKARKPETTEQKQHKNIED